MPVSNKHRYRFQLLFLTTWFITKKARNNERRRVVPWCSDKRLSAVWLGLAFGRLECRWLVSAACRVVSLNKNLCSTLAPWGCDSVVVGALDFSSEDRSFDARSLPPCCLLRQGTLPHIVSLSTQVYKWALVTNCLGVNLWWTSIPSRGEYQYSQLLHAVQKPD